MLKVLHPFSFRQCKMNVYFLQDLRNIILRLNVALQMTSIYHLNYILNHLPPDPWMEDQGSSKKQVCKVNLPIFFFFLMSFYPLNTLEQITIICPIYGSIYFFHKFKEQRPFFFCLHICHFLPLYSKRKRKKSHLIFGFCWIIMIFQFYTSAQLPECSSNP